MKGLNTLIRLADRVVEQRREALAEIAGAIAALDAADAQAKAQSVIEAREVEIDPQTALTYGAYLEWERAERDKRARNRDALRLQEEKERDLLSEAFLELKRLESLAERLAEDQQKLDDKRDLDALDEQATLRHGRGI